MTGGARSAHSFRRLPVAPQLLRARRSSEGEMSLTDRMPPPRRRLARRAAVLLTLIGGLLAGLPSSALALTVGVGINDTADYDRSELNLDEGDGGEANAITVNGGRVRDERAQIRYNGPDKREGGCDRESSQELDCRSPQGGLRIDSGAQDDTIAVDVGNLDPFTVGIVAGSGQDRLRLARGPGYGLTLADGEVDTVTCEQPGRLQIRSRDPQDRFVNCFRDDSSRDGAPLRVDFYARRLQRRSSVLRYGLKVVCAATAPGTCSVRATISGRAARALGIRTRAGRYVVGRGSDTASTSGPNKIRVRLSRRARAALRGRRVRGLAVLLTGTMVDRTGRRATNPFGITIRG